MNDPDSLRHRLSAMPPPSEREAKRLPFQGSWREAPERSSPRPRHCEAPKGLWQSVPPVQTPVPRPSSPVNPRRGSNGGGAPLAVRRGPGEPLWNGSPGASLPSFAALRKKVAPAGAKHPSSKLPSPPRRIDLSTATRFPSPKGEAKRKGSTSPPRSGERALPSPLNGRLILNNTAPAQNAPGPLASTWTYAFSPSGMMQVMRVRQLQEFQPDQGQPSEATGPGAM